MTQNAKYNSELCVRVRGPPHEGQTTQVNIGYDRSASNIRKRLQQQSAAESLRLFYFCASRRPAMLGLRKNVNNENVSDITEEM